MDDTKTTGTVRVLSDGKVRVRLNFVESQRLSFGYGMKQDNEKTIYDPAVYQDAFNKIRNQIFIQKKTN
jgi:acylphosphatase